MITNINIRVSVSQGKYSQSPEKPIQVGQGNHSFPISWAAHHVQPKISPSSYWADVLGPTCFCFRLGPEGSDSAVRLAGKTLPLSSSWYVTQLRWATLGLLHAWADLLQIFLALPARKPEPALDSWGSPSFRRRRRGLALLTTLTPRLVPGDGSRSNCPGIFPYLGSIKAYSSQDFLLQDSKCQELGAARSTKCFIISKTSNFSSTTLHSSASNYFMQDIWRPWDAWKMFLQVRFPPQEIQEHLLFLPCPKCHTFSICFPLQDLWTLGYLPGTSKGGKWWKGDT